jgi:hypothetical protein
MAQNDYIQCAQGNRRWMELYQTVRIRIQVVRVLPARMRKARRQRCQGRLSQEPRLWSSAIKDYRSAKALVECDKRLSQVPRL